MKKKVLVYVEIVYQGTINEEYDYESIEVDWDSGGTELWTRVESEDGNFNWEA